MNDIFTPNGSPVVTFLMDEQSDYLRSYYDSCYISAYPNATPMEKFGTYYSTRKFNCHGYAWLRVGQGIDRWIGTGHKDWGDIDDPEKIYMTDGSYVPVPQSIYPGKVYWGGTNEDHSAITTNHPDTVISKWNEWPLMKHKLNYSPFGGSSNLEYYIFAPTISGVDFIPCSGNVTYSVPSLPATITWYVTNLNIISGQNTNTLTVSKLSGSTGQGAQVIATLTFSDGSTISTSKLMNVGCPRITSLNANTTNISAGSTVYFTAYPWIPTNQGNYEWLVSPSNGVSQSIYRYYNDIFFNQPGYYAVSVRTYANTANGHDCTISPGTFTTVYVNVGSKGGGSSTYLSSVYVDKSNNVTVSFDPSISAINQIFNWQLINIMTGVLVDNGQIASSGGTLNFSRIPAGIYALQIDMGNGIMETHKIVLN